MLTLEEYRAIQQLQTTDPATYKILCKIFDDTQDIASTIIHSVKNQLACVQSSYELIGDSFEGLHEVADWKNISSTIDELNHYMSRLSQLRFSTKSLPISPISINDLLVELPDYIDDLFESDGRYSFDLCAKNPTVQCNREHLKLALSELVINALEVSDDVYISSVLSDKNVIVSIKNETNETLHEVNTDVLCKFYYTTKDKHIGLGLPIVYHICLIYGIKMCISHCANMTSFELVIPMP